MPLFQIMLIFGITKCIVGVCPTIMLLKGKPWLITIATAVMVALFCSLCIPMIRFFGLTGIAWSLVIAGMASSGLLLLFAIVLLRSPHRCRGEKDPDALAVKSVVDRERE